MQIRPNRSNDEYEKLSHVVLGLGQHNHYLLGCLRVLYIKSGHRRIKTRIAFHSVYSVRIHQLAEGDKNRLTNKWRRKLRAVSIDSKSAKEPRPLPQRIGIFTLPVALNVRASQ